MPKITIDGQEIEVAPGATVIQAAERLGIYIPRYCYHPGLRIAGSCRMCLVEVEKMPKLQIACYTRVSDGMNVSTRSEQVLKARQSMLEFLLINHPLDCPVCDQSGECDLQNFYMEHGRYNSRFFEDKIKRKKAYALGPHVSLDQERCILCSRCIRFCEEISESNELGIFQRGNRSVVDLYPGATLDNPYSGNVIDICPVGALTEREFRFKCRVWYLSTQESICPGCSRGCNIAVHFNSSRTYKAEGRRIQRLKPRFNPSVNRWWMCDEGRFGYEFVDQNRIQAPARRRDGELEPCDWETALEEAATAIGSALDRFGPESIGVIASPQHSNEELYLLRKIFAELLEIPHCASRNPWEQEGFQDELLIRGDKNPNSRGALEIGLEGDSRQILEKAASGEIKVLLVFNHDFSAAEPARLLDKTEFLLFQGSNWNGTAQKAHLVLPGCTFAEKDGTFTNFEGRVQAFKQAFLPLAQARSDVEILVQLAGKLGLSLVYKFPEELFLEWFGKSYQELDEFGEMVENRASAVTTG